MNKSNILITIDRQVGSGGKYLGKRLAEKFKFSYYDAEIVKEAAQDLQASVEEIEGSDEKQGGILNAFSHANFRYYPDVEIITDDQAHKAESNVI